MTPNSTLAYDSDTIYTFSFVPSHDIPIGGKLKVVLPDDMSIPSPSITSNSCQVDDGIEPTFSCEATSNSITITDGFLDDEYSSGNVITFRASILLNPISLEESGSFTITTYTADDYFIDEISEGATVTMTETPLIASISVIPDSLQNGASSIYTVAFVPGSPLVNGDIIVLEFPTDVKVSDTPTCQGDTSLAADLECSATGNTVSVTLEMLTGDEIQAGEVLRLLITGFTNPLTAEPTDDIVAKITNARGFEVNHYEAPLKISMTEASELAAASVSTSNNIPLEQVDVEIDLTLTTQVPGEGAVYVFYPIQMSIDETALTCQQLEPESRIVPCTLTSTSE